MALISAAQVKTHYPALIGGNQDAKLATLIDWVDAEFAKFCGWPRTATGAYTMESATYVLFPEPHHAHPQALDVGLFWMGSITSAYVDSLWEYGSNTEVSTSDLVIDNQRGLLWQKPNATGPAWLDSPRANKLTLTAGFVSATDDLVMMAAVTVRHIWNMGFDQGAQTVSFGEVNETKVDRDRLEIIPLAVQKALGPLKTAGAYGG